MARPVDHPLRVHFRGFVRHLWIPPNREAHTETLNQIHKRGGRSVSMSPFYFGKMLVTVLVGRQVCVYHRSHRRSLRAKM